MNCTIPAAKGPRGSISSAKKIFLDELLDDLDRRVDELSRGNPRLPLAACWDFDGTIIDGDITEGQRHPDPARSYQGMMDTLLSADLIPGYSGPGATPRFWAEYARLIEDAGHREAYIFLAEVLAPLSPASLQHLHQLLDPLLPNYYRPHLMPESLYLIDAFHQRKIHNFVISASPHLFVGKVAAMLPEIPLAHLSGINRLRHVQPRGDILIDPLVNYAEGKQQRAAAFSAGLGGRMLFAAGNSWHSDGPMLHYACEQGGIALMINGGEAPSWAENLPIYQLHLP